MRRILAIISVCSTCPAHVVFHFSKFEVLLRTPAHDTKRFLFSSKFQSFHAIWKLRLLVCIFCSDWLEAILLSEIMWTCVLSWLPWLYENLCTCNQGHCCVVSYHLFCSSLALGLNSLMKWRRLSTKMQLWLAILLLMWHWMESTQVNKGGLQSIYEYGSTHQVLCCPGH